MQRAASQAAGPLLPGPCPFPGVPPWCPAPGDPPGPDPGTPCVQLGPWQVSLAPAGPLGEASSTAAVNASTNLIADLPSGVPVSGTPSSCRTTATARALATYQTAGASPRWARRSAEETVRGTPQAKHDSEGREPLPCDKLAPCAPSGTREIVGAPSSTWHVASNRVLALGRTQRAPESGGSEPSESKEATRPPWDNPPMALELRRWVPR